MVWQHIRFVSVDVLHLDFISDYLIFDCALDWPATTCGGPAGRLVTDETTDKKAEEAALGALYELPDATKLMLQRQYCNTTIICSA